MQHFMKKSQFSCEKKNENNHQIKGSPFSQIHLIINLAFDKYQFSCLFFQGLVKMSSGFGKP